VRADSGAERLFRLESDPHELDDVAAEQPEVTARLRGEVERELARLEERGRALRGGAAAPLEPEVVEGLRELGYVDEE
jgi:hypothetical protein